MPSRSTVTGASAPGFAKHVRFRHDDVRGQWVVLSPEKLFVPDEQAVEILKLVDGARSVDAIVDDLAQRFNAPRDVIATDIIAMLQELADKGVLTA